jgi:outer membrane protein assembly factor BamE (lipoprotein component of BamABCDE complex)
MNRGAALSVVVLALGLMPMPGFADDKQLSPERLDMVDQMGYFTPGFKQAVHDYVFTKQSLEKVTADQTSLSRQLPDLQKQATQAQANAVALRQELARYEHPDENDFGALQERMNDTGATTQDQIALAQAYVWTYPSSPHESDAQQYLQQLQKKVSDQEQSRKDAEAARAAAQAALVKRALAHDLNPAEWRDFLRGMSEDDLVKLIGRPTSQSGDYWIYDGDWTEDKTTQRKVGLEINFNAGRVLTVDEKPSPP